MRRKRGVFIPTEVHEVEERYMIFFLATESWSYYWNHDTDKVYRYYNDKWEILMEKK